MIRILGNAVSYPFELMIKIGKAEKSERIPVLFLSPMLYLVT